MYVFHGTGVGDGVGARVGVGDGVGVGATVGDGLGLGLGDGDGAADAGPDACALSGRREERGQRS